MSEATSAPTRVGIVGCGTISGIYLQMAQTFELFDVVACADLDLARAQARASEYGVPRACTVDELLADPQVALIINLTTPDAHAEIGLRAVRAGKSVYNEKPLTIALADARELLDTAATRDVRVGCAPDTFLGAGLQTCRKLLDDGWIGEPLAATAFMLGPGHESWHPNPGFYYQPGGGPLFDMGPYYLTALITLLGPVRRVSGAARASYAERLITSQPRRGERIVVNTPTHIATVLDFAAGPIATLVTSFDTWASEVPLLEIYGSEGTLSLPDPNTFGGPVRLRRAGAAEWRELPLSHSYAANSRGLGVADMCAALHSGRPHRASGELAYHVLEVMHAALDSAQQSRHIELASSYSRPAPLPLGLREGMVDA